MRVRITGCSSKHTWYKDKIGEEFDIYEIDDNTITSWERAKPSIGRDGKTKYPILSYLTTIREGEGFTLWRISPQDCENVKVLRRDELINQLI